MMEQDKMIDDEREVRELLQALNECLPMTAYPTLGLVKAVGEPGIRVNGTLQVDSLVYLGDEGGIACAIKVRAGQHVVASLTHLRIDPNHPLSERIDAYQKRRSQRLAAASRSSPKQRAKLRAKRRRK